MSQEQNEILTCSWKSQRKEPYQQGHCRRDIWSLVAYINCVNEGSQSNLGHTTHNTLLNPYFVPKADRISLTRETRLAASVARPPLEDWPGNSQSRLLRFLVSRRTYFESLYLARGGEITTLYLPKQQYITVIKVFMTEELLTQRPETPIYAWTQELRWWIKPGLRMWIPYPRMSCVWGLDRWKRTLQVQSTSGVFSISEQ